MKLLKKAFEFIKNEDIDWLKVDLKGDMIIETGLSPTTAMEAKNSGTALNEEYVLGRIEDQPGGPADEVSRVHQEGLAHEVLCLSGIRTPSERLPTQAG